MTFGDIYGSFAPFKLDDPRHRKACVYAIHHCVSTKFKVQKDSKSFSGQRGRHMHLVLLVLHLHHNTLYEMAKGALDSGGAPCELNHGTERARARVSRSIDEYTAERVKEPRVYEDKDHDESVGRSETIIVYSSNPNFIIPAVVPSEVSEES